MSNYFLKDNPGKIKLVIRYATFHHGSDYMVKILEAARKQGKFWETLEVMYNTQDYWASRHNPQPQLIWKFLPNVGLNLENIKNDIMILKLKNLSNRILQMLKLSMSGKHLDFL